MTPEKVFKRMLMVHPFYGLFLLTLNKEYSDKISTAGVARDGVGVKLVINLNWWNTLSDDVQLAVIYHECLHICLGHIFEPFKVFEQYGHEILNYSMDYEVNSYLNEKDIKEVNGLWAPDMGWPLKKGTKWYYEELIKFARESLKNGNSNEQDSSKNGSLNDLSIGGQLIDDHNNWGEFSEATAAEKELMKNQIDYQIKQTAEQTMKMHGTIPGELQEKINQLFEKKPAVFNWKKYFRRLIGTQIDINLKKTYKRESVRFPDMAGIRRKKKCSILVAIDTSGSVNIKNLVDFFNEIYHIWKAGAVVKVLECDVRINKEYLYTGKCPELISGRGGTSFNEAITYFNDNYRDYTTMVYFTDGYCNIDVKPRNNNCIWILTSDGYEQEYPGKVIKIPKQ